MHSPQLKSEDVRLNLILVTKYFATQVDAGSLLDAPMTVNS